jgi:hypothetical protein
MLILRKVYIVRKDESLSVIHGEGHYVFFNEDGSLRENIKLSKFNIDLNSSKESFFVRINRYIFHKIKVDTDYMLIHEATTGPFIKSDTDYKIYELSNSRDFSFFFGKFVNREINIYLFFIVRPILLLTILYYFLSSFKQMSKSFIK